MIKQDLHTHSVFSDGNNTIEEIVKSAIALNLDTIGISDHSYTEFDTSYCIKKDRIPDYISEINSLKNKYKGIIDVKCGIEQDYYSTCDTSDFDYTIGSVHYIKVNEEYIPVDESAEILLSAVSNHFNGDIYSLVELYFETVSDVVNKTNADIIGHFDLITKFNENNKLFDENNIRYVNAYKRAANALLKTGKVFEINTGAISRGYRTSPYPSSDIYRYLKNKGAKFILSSDSHSVDSLCFRFNEYDELIN